jgi:hypothetical protein
MAQPLFGIPPGVMPGLTSMMILSFSLRGLATLLLIRPKRIYNFLCSMLIYTPFALCFVTLRGVFMHFPELTY